MSDRLTYNTDNLRKSAQIIIDMADNLETARGDLSGALDSLKNDWRSDASNAFFDKYDSQWLVQLEKYVSMLQVLAAQLNSAADEYDDLTREYNCIGLG